MEAFWHGLATGFGWAFGLVFGIGIAGVLVFRIGKLLFAMEFKCETLAYWLEKHGLNSEPAKPSAGKEKVPGTYTPAKPPPPPPPPPKRVIKEGISVGHEQPKATHTQGYQPKARPDSAEPDALPRQP